MRLLMFALATLAVALVSDGQPAKSQGVNKGIQATNKAAMRDCQRQYRGGRGSSIKPKDRYGWIEGCYVQKTGKYPWQ
jgi:hypothetical protein